MAKKATTQTTQTVLPAWYNQYAQNLLGKAEQATSEPYQAYGAPRIAGFAPEQQQAFGMTAGRAGSYQPFFGQSQQMTQVGAQGSATQAAQPYLGQATGSFVAPGVAEQYMNPYIQQVVSGIGDLAARNLSENLLPQVNRTFVGGGTFGGSRSADFTARAVRDAQEAALREQAGLMQQGYGQAADIFGAEAGRALGAGQAIGQLSSSDYARMLEGARQMGALGEASQTAGLREVGALAGVGEQRQALAQQSADLAYQDFLEQRDYPYQQVQRLAGLGATVGPQGSGTTTQMATAPGPSKTAQVLGTITGLAGTIGSLFKDGGKVQARNTRSGLGWLKEARA